eukprot:TRINITY_DN15943_c0_g1_i1.p1 TRINITY_DN15943_c0_g1~~TRINITY_DN15943_c0_g1_i1.p1  ORF type:complete len:332 (-),score=104.82 TRINITY_DN15943_c0_g1_i1:188-1183(-)
MAADADAPPFVHSEHSVCVRDREGSFEERRERLEARLEHSRSISKGDLMQRNIVQSINVVRRGSRSLEPLLDARPTLQELVEEKRLPPDYLDRLFPTDATGSVAPLAERIERVSLHRLLPQDSAAAAPLRNGAAQPGAAATQKGMPLKPPGYFIVPGAQDALLAPLAAGQPPRSAVAVAGAAAAAAQAQAAVSAGNAGQLAGQSGQNFALDPSVLANLVMQMLSVSSAQPAAPGAVAGAGAVGGPPPSAAELAAAAAAAARAVAAAPAALSPLRAPSREAGFERPPPLSLGAGQGPAQRRDSYDAPFVQLVEEFCRIAEAKDAKGASAYDA